MYLIFLVFHCQALSDQIRLNEEFSEYRWVSEGEIPSMDINDVTLDTLHKIGSWRTAR